MAGYVPTFHRVFLVEDHDIVRRGVRDLLVATKDIQVIGEADSAKEAPREILASGADVMLLDLQLGDGTGIDVCREVRAADPTVRGLLLTSASDDEALVAAILAGASGYLVKLVRSTNITWAIRQLAPGKSLIEPASADDARRLATAGLDDIRPPISQSERELLALVIAGDTNNDVANKLGMALEDATVQVSALVRRLMHALFGSGSSSAQPSTGRHRRHD